jgi:membrane protein DedA with SNARE-associated domain
MEGAPPSRRKLVLLISGIGLVIVAGTIATAFTPILATRHPLLLIALDSRNRMLILARRVDVVPFFVVGTLRRLASDPLYWLLGYWYGDRAIRWLQTKGGGGELVVWTERAFAKAAYPMVFLVPGAVVCALAGATRMPFAAFLATNLAGTVTAVTAVRLSSDLLASPVDAVLEFFRDHWLVMTAATIALTVLSIVLNRASQVPSVNELQGDDEHEAVDDTPAEEPRPEEGTA